MLRRILGSNRDEVTGKLRKLHNEELSDIYSSPNIIRVIKSGKNEMGGTRSVYEGEKRWIHGFGGET